MEREFSKNTGLLIAIKTTAETFLIPLNSHSPLSAIHGLTQSSSTSNPRPTFTCCTQNDIMMVLFCLNRRRKKSTVTLLSNVSDDLILITSSWNRSQQVLFFKYLTRSKNQFSNVTIFGHNFVFQLIKSLEYVLVCFSLMFQLQHSIIQSLEKTQTKFLKRLNPK